MLAKVSQDCRDIGQIPSSYGDEFSQELCSEIFLSCQPELIEDCEFNTIIRTMDGSRYFLVNSIDFVFFEVEDKPCIGEK